MAKFVVETVMTTKIVYYVEVPDVDWACDGIVMNELELFMTQTLSEDVFSTREVSEFPTVPRGSVESVNGAVEIFDESAEQWMSTARWDLVESMARKD